MIKNKVEAIRKKQGLNIPFVMAKYKKIAGEENAISDHVFWQIRDNRRSITVEEMLIFAKIFGEKNQLKLIVNKY